MFCPAYKLFLFFLGGSSLDSRAMCCRQIIMAKPHSQFKPASGNQSSKLKNDAGEE